MAAPLLAPGQAVFGTVVKFSPWPHAQNVSSAPTRLQLQLDLLNQTPHPYPYRKPFMAPAPHGSLLLALENMHFTQAEADAGSLSWAWQIARQAEMSELEWDATVEASQQVTPHRQS